MSDELRIGNKAKNFKGQEGYIALTSVIIVCLLLITIITVLSSTNYFSRYNILENEFKERSSGLAEACVDYALSKVAADPTYTGPETANIGTYTCSVNSVSPSGTGYAISTTGTYPQPTSPASSYTNLLVTVDSNFKVIFWQETP